MGNFETINIGIKKNRGSAEKNALLLVGVSRNTFTPRYILHRSPLSPKNGAIREIIYWWGWWIIVLVGG